MKGLTQTFILATIIFIVFASPAFAVSDNLLKNGGFESGSNGWEFGDINRAVYEDSVYPGAYQGNYWLDTSGGQDSLTVYQNVYEQTVIGQRYQASVYYRSGSGGRAKLVIWFLGGEEKEIADSGWVKGDENWQKIQINKEIYESGHDRIKVQIYMNKQDPAGTQWQFDNVSLINRPWIMGHKFLYHHVPNNVFWGGKYGHEQYDRGSIEGWGECKVCQGNPWKDVGADVRRIIGPEPWRREFGNGDCETYPYLGIYDDSNWGMMKYYIDSQQNTGIDGWQIAFWSAALPDSYSQVDSWYYDMFQFLRNKIVPYFNEIGFKFYITDEMVYNWGGDLETSKMKNKATAVLKTFKDEPSYLRINGKPVYFLPIISNYARRDKIDELNNALSEVEKSIGEKVFWLGYTGEPGIYEELGKSKLKAIYDGYGLSNTATDGKVSSKINNFSDNSKRLKDNGLGFVVGVQPSFVGTCFNGDEARKFERQEGQRFKNSIKVFQNIKPRPIIASIFQAEWQEGKTIEPAASWADDSSHDPYKYLKILSNSLVKTDFTAPDLPPADQIDPLRAGQVYGRGAQAVDYNFPEEVMAGENFELTVEYKNTGQAPWSRQTLTFDKHGWYRLKIEADWDIDINYLDLGEQDVVRQGEAKKFAVNLNSPSQSGIYTFSVQMDQYGFTTFGEKVSKNIQVLATNCQACASGLPKTEGNADCNSKIDLVDYAAWLKVFKSEGTEEQKGAVDFDCEAESDSEHIVDLADFRLWLDNFLAFF